MKVADWFASQGFEPAAFQRELWSEYASGKNGLLIAPTGSGKTYAVMGAIAAAALETVDEQPGLKVIWITPLRALATDIALALSELVTGVGLKWEVELRTGDTSASNKRKQRKRLPEILVTTPESLHVMLSYPQSSQLFTALECVVVDEWHELLGSKRGIMMQLGLAHLRSVAPGLRVWGISATIGNPAQAMKALLSAQTRPQLLVQDIRHKTITIQTVIPTDIERFPWAGHLGDRLLSNVLEIIQSSATTLVFTNTRNQSEVWYRKLLAADRNLAGRIALHHGSLSNVERAWVEGALHGERLKAVVCTSTLDLGVDFRPVDTVVQIGSPKGVARIMQRAGRSGHAPGAISKLYFVPTNALELFEAAALKEAVAQRNVEPIMAPIMSLDVLVQWLVTLGSGDGFNQHEVFREVKQTAAYCDITPEIWNWAINFVTTGGAALSAYENFRKLEADESGRLYARNREITTRHRQAIGAITSSTVIRVQLLRGRVFGSVEETFAASLTTGQIFWFSGRALEFVRIREMTLWVRLSKSRSGVTPSWAGGRLPLSNQLAAQLRRQVALANDPVAATPELQALQPLSILQQAWSKLPQENELLVEQFDNREGSHLLIYPFEGRSMHEVIAALLAARIGKEPNTFSFSYNDYGFELLSAKPVVLSESSLHKLLSPDNLAADIAAAIENGTMPRRQFRSIAIIAGLVTNGRPGKPHATRHVQASSEMVYDVFKQHDPHNQLLRQSQQEVLDQVVDISRLQQTLERVAACDMLLTYPPRATPLAFPLMVDRLRERLTTEKFTDRVTRMQMELEKYANALRI